MYNIIYADPPWTYKDKALAGRRGAACKYKVMSLKEIKALPVSDIAADNCVLFLWSTMPMLNKVFDVIDAWGFTYKTCAFTWVKRNKVTWSWFWGMGNWTRSNPEVCLLAIKGKPKRESASVHSIIESRRLSHSEKPPEVRDRIIQLCGDLPRIELFARKNVKGWHAWGDEVENSQFINFTS